MENVKNHDRKEGKNIYLNALQFSRIYDIVNESYNPNSICIKDSKVINVDRISKTIIAELVNLAFADELYLKAILKNEKIDYQREHRLDKLYNLLSTETQKYIKDNTIMSYKELHGQDVDFNSFLKKNANIFVEWRYGFEKSPVADLDLFITFSMIVEFYAISIFEPEYIKK